MELVLLLPIVFGKTFLFDGVAPMAFFWSLAGLIAIGIVVGSVVSISSWVIKGIKKLNTIRHTEGQDNE